ncbi:MAG: hypothetical protein IPK25_14945 [Saprospiraceae bacterium]|nr:hypothetical protein [Saprospiraceae bacterium]
MKEGIDTVYTHQWEIEKEKNVQNFYLKLMPYGSLRINHFCKNISIAMTGHLMENYSYSLKWNKKAGKRQSAQCHSHNGIFLQTDHIPHKLI